MRKNRSSIPSRPVFRIRFRVMKLLELAFQLFGRSKCGVLVMLKPSARNCSSVFSVIWNLRMTPRSRLNSPGPRSLFGPHMPKRSPLGCTNASASIQTRLASALT